MANLTIKKIAASAHISEVAVWALIRQDILKSSVERGQVVVSSSEWEEFAESKRGKEYVSKHQAHIGTYHC